MCRGLCVCVCTHDGLGRSSIFGLITKNDRFHPRMTPICIVCVCVWTVADTQRAALIKVQFVSSSLHRETFERKRKNTPTSDEPDLPRVVRSDFLSPTRILFSRPEVKWEECKHGKGCDCAAVGESADDGDALHH